MNKSGAGEKTDGKAVRNFHLEHGDSVDPLDPKASAAGAGLTWVRTRGPWRAAALGFALLAGAFAAFLPVRANVDKPAFFLTPKWWVQPREVNSIGRSPLIGTNIVGVAVSGNGGIILAGREDGKLLRSQDNGATWTIVSLGLGSVFVAITPSGANAVAVVGNKLMRSSDSGRIWSRVTSVETTGDAAFGNIANVAIAGNGTAIAVGEYTLLRSTDFGAKWTSVDLRKKAGIHLNFVAITPDGRAALAVGNYDVTLVSRDGGLTWLSVSFAEQGESDAAGVSIADDGLNALMALGGGTLLRSDNGGSNWTLVNTGLSGEINSLAVARRGSLAFAAGDNGMLLRSSDNGGRWTASGPFSTARLTAIAVTPDGNTAFAGGEGGILLKSFNGGKTWRPAISYREGVAPIFWTALILSMAAALALFMPASALGGGGQPTVGTLSDIFATDRPLEDDDPDVAGAAILADRLSRFLRNRRTQPPLAVAITGEWGSGKSSVLNKLASDLRQHGIRPVRFNAWHHQKEDHVFAALLQAVREQAVPPAICFAGLAVRSRLFAARLRRRWLLWLTTIVALFAVVGATMAAQTPTLQEWSLASQHRADKAVSPPSSPLNERVLNKNPSSALQNEPSSILTGPDLARLTRVVPSSGKFAAIVVVLLNLLAQFRDRLKDSGLDAGRLMSSAGGATRWRDLGGQLAFRVRFADALKEVTDALGKRTLTILIDDLDRCEPQSVAEIMEAINFLTSSGGCFIVLAIAPAHVLAAMGLAHAEMAKEVAPIEITDERAARDRYARQYIEKLIQIEIPVPSFDAKAAHRLVTGALKLRSDANRDRPWATVLVGLSIVTLLGTGYLGGYQAVKHFAPAPVPTNPAPDVTPGAPASQPNTTAQSSQGSENHGVRVSAAAAQSGHKTLVPGRDRSAESWALLPMTIAAAAAALDWLRRRALHVVEEDAPDFARGLDLWAEAAFLARPSPREMKRFLNRLRLAATALTPNATTVGLATFAHVKRALVEDFASSGQSLVEIAKRMREDHPGEPVWAALAAAAVPGDEAAGQGPFAPNRDEATVFLNAWAGATVRA